MLQIREKERMGNSLKHLRRQWTSLIGDEQIRMVYTVQSQRASVVRLACERKLQSRQFYQIDHRATGHHIRRILLLPLQRGLHVLRLCPPKNKPEIFNPH
jgi:hypothetical protein